MSDFATTLVAVSVCVQAKVPCLIEDDPGCAKSVIVSALQRQLCDETHTSIAALHEPPEYGGYPYPVMDHTTGKPLGVYMLPLAWQTRLAGAQTRAGLCLDELTNAPPATRSAAMRGIHEGVWGETEIPKLSTVAIQNPAEVAESGYELSAALSNRFCRIRWNMPVPYWVEQMLAGFPAPAATRLPPDWQEQHIGRARALLSGFAIHRPGSMQALPADPALRSQPWPSFRSWTNALTLLAACASIGETIHAGTVRDEHDADAIDAAVKGLSPLVALLVAGCVGPDAAREFFTYTASLDLPDPEDLLRNPRSLQLPDRGDKAYAVLAAVVGAVLTNNTRERWTAAFEVLGFAHDAGKGDIAAACARNLAKDEHRPKTFDSRAIKAINKFEPMLRAAGIVRGAVGS